MHYKLNIDRYNVDMNMDYLELEHSRVLKLAIARTKTFNDHGNNYYWKRLQDLDWIIEIKKSLETKLRS